MRAMTRAEAAVTLGVPVGAGRPVVEAAFRRRSKLAHPDAGGDPIDFAGLVAARRRLLEGSATTPQPAVVVSRRARRVLALRRAFRLEPPRPPRVR